MDIGEVVPQLGKFMYSPLYLYVRKRDGHVIEIKTVTSPSASGNHCEEFLRQIGRLFRQPGIGQVQIDVDKQAKAYYFKRDLDEGWDVNFDCD